MISKKRRLVPRVVLVSFFILSMLYLPTNALADSPGEIKKAPEPNTYSIAYAADSEYLASAKVTGYIGGDIYIDWNYGSRGEAWCVDFVSYCANQSGLIKNGRYPNPSLRKGDGAYKYATCNVSTLRKWFIDKKKGVNYANDGTYFPMKGDLVLRGGAHIGIVYKVKDNQFWTIEGNAGHSDNRYSSVLRQGPFKIGDTDTWTDFINITYKFGNNAMPNISKALITGGPKNNRVDATGSKRTPASYVVKIGGKVLEKSKYELHYKNNVIPGTATVYFYAKNQLDGNKPQVYKGYSVPTKKFTIIGKPIYEYISTDKGISNRIYSDNKNLKKFHGHSYKRTDTVFQTIPGKSSRPVNAFINYSTGQIHYTSNAGVKLALTSKKFTDLGIQFYGDSTGRNVIYHYCYKGFMSIKSTACARSASKATATDFLNKSKTKYKNHYGKKGMERYESWNPLSWKTQ